MITMNTQDANLTETQRAVLSILRAAKVAGQRLLPAHEARAVGGLSDNERNERIGCRPDGQTIGNVHVGARRVRGASVATLAALVSMGLAENRSGIFVAV